jgi:hypothetical protein
MEEMTITRALAEKKMLEKRLDKEFNGASFISVRKNDRTLMPMGVNPKDQEEKIKASYQKIYDIIDRINTIKTKIADSNHNTVVTLAGVEMTVEEVLIEKQCIPLKERLLNQMKHSLNTATACYEREVSKRDSSAVELRSQFGTSKSSDEVEKLIKNFLTLEEIEYIDPIDIRKQIEDLETWLEDFNSNVDFVLSTSNSLTKIQL